MFRNQMITASSAKALIGLLAQSLLKLSLRHAFAETVQLLAFTLLAGSWGEDSI